MLGTVIYWISETDSKQQQRDSSHNVQGFTLKEAESASLEYACYIHTNLHTTLVMLQ